MAAQQQRHHAVSGAAGDDAAEDAIVTTYCVKCSCFYIAVQLLCHVIMPALAG